MTNVSRPFSRRRILVGSGVAAASVASATVIDGFCITPRRLVTTTHAFGESESAGPTVRIAQVTDLHMATLGPLHETLAARLHDAAPSVIVLTGDMIERPGSMKPLDDLLGQLPDVPTFAVIGNWEYWSGVPIADYRRLYDSHAIDLLVNRSVTIDFEGRPLRITGLDDLKAGNPDPAATLAGEPPCPNHLLLAHCPATRDAFPLPAPHRPGLILSGHTHGGQIAPFGYPVVLPSGSGRYVAGWYRTDGPPLYVSRGIGTSLIPVRIGSTPELSIFDWRLA